MSKRKKKDGPTKFTELGEGGKSALDKLSELRPENEEPTLWEDNEDGGSLAPVVPKSHA